MKEISISPNKILFGEETTIKLEGFDAEQEIELEAKFTSDDNKTYISRAIFRTNTEGKVDLSNDAPISGSYHGVVPMGLIVSMEEENTKENFTYVKTDLKPNFTEFTVYIKGEKIVSSTLEQFILDERITQEKLQVSEGKGTLFIPNSSHDTIVICFSGSDGGESKSMASLFASNGFMSLSLAYFDDEGLPKTLSKIPLEYFEKTFEFLQNDSRTKDKKISIVAGSKGAELALLLASRYSFIHSVVAYVPSHVLWNGFGDYKQMKCSSWTHNGKELAFVQIKMKFMNLLKYFFSKQPLEFTSTYLYSLNNKIDNDAIIKVENIKGNILLISGTDDKMWCSALMGDKIMQRLEEHNFQYEYEHLSYEGAGHMITTPYFPAKHKEYSHPADNKIYALGGDMYADLKASEDSWKKVLAFLKK